MIIDTGSSCTLVHHDFVPEKLYSGQTMDVQFADGSQKQINDVLLGHDSLLITNRTGNTFAVTRAQAKRKEEKEAEIKKEIDKTEVKVSPLTDENDDFDITNDDTVSASDNSSNVSCSISGDSEESKLCESDISDYEDEINEADLPNDGLNSTLKLTKEQIMILQQKDTTLMLIRNKVRTTPSTSETSYFLQDGIIFRRSFDSKRMNYFVDQLVVPKSCREDLLTIAHSIPLAGHLGVDKTRDRLLAHYFWPNIYKDVQQFCSTCPECQKTGRKLRSEKAALKPIVPIGVPFKKIGIDIVGPLPRSNKGNRFILTVADFATKYPEAFPIPSQTAEVVADALIELFSRVGIPDEIVSDQGTNFMSSLITQLCETLGIRKIKSSVYYPQTNGLVERLNGTLKSMLRKFVHDEPKTWDKVLPYVLFSYREVPESSTGFSPFELVYGWPIRGPLSIIKENWLEQENQETSVIEYILETRSKLSKCVELAQKYLTESQKKMKTWYDKDARGRTYQEGEEVLVLLPTTSRSLEAQWQGPFKITRKLSDLDYEVDTGRHTKRLRVFHTNLLKKWKSRRELVMFSNNDIMSEVYCPLKSSENWKDVEISEHLTSEQKQMMSNLLEKYSCVFSDKPSITNVAVHHIETLDAKPIRQAPYRIPHALKEKFQAELEDMLKQGIIEKSNSNWAAPVVIVPKKQDGVQTGIRICVDFRKLNSVSNFDAYPLPRMEDLIENLGEAKFITKLDLTKGYYQIPLSPETKEKSAFITPSGLYQFNVMPFGMKSAPATFQRMMHDVLAGLELFVGTYIDDIIIHSPTFEDHLQHVEKVFERLAEARLVAKPSKCVAGHAQVSYLGHLVGVGEMQPLRSKVECIERYPIPETKKQLRSFLGLVSYYRRYIPDFSEIAAPLTDCTGKKYSNKVKWSSECDKAFSALKQRMSSFPILYLPDFSKPFIVQVDASERGLGAVLCQTDDEGQEHPIVYNSRKLLDRERKLATTEKECLGIVWAVELLKPYLYGTEFVIETDHNALVWLEKFKDTNQKLLRWSLQLQQYSFKVRHKKGSENKNADALSRI